MRLETGRAITAGGDPRITPLGSVLRRWKLLEESGIRFELNCGVGEGIGLAELRDRHDAVLIATGVYQARDIGGPGAGLAGIVPALDYLFASNRIGLGDTVADLANGPTRFGQPHLETVALLEQLGSANSHNCRSDQCLGAPKEDKKPTTATTTTATATATSTATATLD